MIDHLDLKIKLFLYIAPIFLCGIGLAVDLRIACSREYEAMASALQKSKCFEFATAVFSKQNIRGRVMIISMISNDLMNPTASIRRGSLDTQDYLNFPKPLKRKIIFSSRINGAGILWLILDYFFL